MLDSIRKWVRRNHKRYPAGCVCSRQNRDEHERHVITTGCGHGWETQLWVCTEAIRIGSAQNATRTVKANEHDSLRDQFLPNAIQSRRVSINNPLVE